MNREKTTTWIVLIILFGGLIYAITLINQPGGDFIKNLTEPPKPTADNETMGTKPEIMPQPGDEKLVKKDLVVGTGIEAKAGDTVTVNYVGTLENGKKFDSSYDRKTPFSFELGSGQVIRGWEIGLLGMKVGGKRELIIPPELAYGETGQGPIPSNATLKFTIELLDAKNIGEQQIQFNP